MNNEEFALKEDTNPNPVSKLFRMFQTEDEKLRADLRSEIGANLGLSEKIVESYLFAGPKNNQVPLFCSKQNSAWKYNWVKLLQNEKGNLWLKPPFSKLLQTLPKYALDKARLLIVTAEWGHTGQSAYWRRILDRLTVKWLVLPNVPLYQKFGDAKKLLPPPQWPTMVSVLDGKINEVALDELDKSLVHALKKRTKNWGRVQFEQSIAENEKEKEGIELEASGKQTGLERYLPVAILLPADTSTGCSTPSAAGSPSQLPVGSCPVSPIPADLSGSKSFFDLEETFDFWLMNATNVLADLFMEVELPYPTCAGDKWGEEPAQLFVLQENLVNGTRGAQPKGKIPVSQKDLENLAA